ncbi:MAG: ZIP family metal transporter [Bdellovibrionales bacterium]|nr:ZIP family metal transporter [Bdellovibrionales bacterium]
MSWESLLFIAIVVILTVLGGSLMANKGEKDVLRVIPPFLSFGTGILLSVAITEFIPHAFTRNDFSSSYWLLAGILTVIVADKYLAPLLGPQHSKHCTHHSHGPKLLSSSAACSSIGCIIVCAFFDGIEIFTAFQLGPDIGWFLALGLFFHVVPEGAIVAGLSLAGGFGKKSAYKSVFYIALAILLGVFGGSQIVNYIDFHKNLLPFASGVLLYVSIGHLLPIALKNRGGIFIVVLGALVMSLIKQFLGHIH